MEVHEVICMFTESFRRFKLNLEVQIVLMFIKSLVDSWCFYIFYLRLKNIQEYLYVHEVFADSMT